MTSYALFITYLPLIIGGAISWLIAKNMKPGMPPQMSPYEQNPYMQNGYGQMPGGQAFNGQPPYGQNPYGQGPNGQTSFGQAPYGQMPYGQDMNSQNPNGQMPYGQSAYQQNPYGQMFGNQMGMQQNQQSMYGGYAEPYDAEKMLQVPCTICIMRDVASTGANELYTVSLNGHHACQLANGTIATIMTNQKQNTVTARDGSGASLLHPITFMAVDGGYVEIHMSGGSFQPEKTIGRKPVTPQA